MKIDETNFLYSLSSIRHGAFSFLESSMAEAGITDLPPSYGDILHAIHGKKGASVSDIVALSHKDKSTVSNIINQLEKRGYVEKKSSPEDGRRVQVTLSPKAESYIGAMAGISTRLQEKLFQAMSEEEQGILFMLLRKVGANLNR